MTRTTATALCGILILSLFSGCCPKQPDMSVVYIPQKCAIPAVEKPIIDNETYELEEDIVSKAIFNYIEMRQYAQKLLAAQEVCR